MKSPIAASVVAVASLAGLPTTAGADFRRCEPVRNVFEGTRYEGSDLYRIRAQGTSCKTARRVARRAIYKGVASTPDSTGHVRVTYRRWSIVGDLRGSADTYSARAAAQKRVRWIFGDI
jgi:hypothetical protein